MEPRGPAGIRRRAPHGRLAGVVALPMIVMLSLAGCTGGSLGRTVSTATHRTSSGRPATSAPATTSAPAVAKDALDPCALLTPADYAGLSAHTVDANHPLRLERGLLAGTPPGVDCTVRIGMTAGVSFGYELHGHDFVKSMNAALRSSARLNSLLTQLHLSAGDLRSLGIGQDGRISGVGDRAYLTEDVVSLFLTGHAQQGDRMVDVALYDVPSPSAVKQLLTTMLSRYPADANTAAVSVPSGSGCPATTTSTLTGVLGRVAYARGSRAAGLPFCSYSDNRGHVVQISSDRHASRSALLGWSKIAAVGSHRVNGSGGSFAFVDASGGSVWRPGQLLSTSLEITTATDTKTPVLPAGAREKLTRWLLAAPPLR